MCRNGACLKNAQSYNESCHDHSNDNVETHPPISEAKSLLNDHRHGALDLPRHTQSKKTHVDGQFKQAYAHALVK